MRALFIFIFLLLWCQPFAQVSYSGLSLPFGKFAVGFRHYTRNDSTRTYTRIGDWNNKAIPRPIPVSLWYPAPGNSHGNEMVIRDYMVILKEEEEWESLPDNRILDWFYYSNTVGNRKHLEEKVKAVRNAQQLQGRFPVVVYAPSYQASSVENFAICEFLASRGFVVISSPSRGTDNRLLDGGTSRDIETQARDIQFLVSEISRQPFVDVNKLAVMGFSFGGISNVLAQMMDKRIKAVICLDGSIKYQLPKIQSSPYYRESKFDVPFMFMSQKDIPVAVMREDKIESSMNSTFIFYDSLKYSNAYSLKFNLLTHAYFSAMGVLFQDRDPRQDKTDAEIMESYKWVNIYAVNFLEAFLNNNKTAKAYLDNQPAINGIPGDAVVKTSKISNPKPFSFEDFNLLAEKQEYQDLDKLVAFIRVEWPAYKLEEWKANNLGLSLLFNNKIKEGINVLELNTGLFPESANAHDSLGEAYFLAGDKQNAMNSFNTSLKYDPGNQNAINRLQQLSSQ